ncbi:hypothetical protein [Mesorhizobium onobrychidis]|uniref:Uncharacterized protein n=1 Tax=Mesorhizobium onobrychidis TaxID=2775404 RepID=A0ABY5QRV0_9HYPH|nr:hypothetical protein [Mesorhizobium onobrychidis]UVC13768.1 hypothetical protein IHQ72_24125 [Mesorhizobium onobrychidis]
MRFKTHHEAVRKCVLLYVGDHDPAGLLISDVIKSNLMDCANVKGVDFDPSPIRVERIGLTREQIDDLGLPWIENLETGSGKDLGDPGHPDHRKPYVQNYIASQGRRKVEANALVRDLRGSRALVEAAINRYIPASWPAEHEARLAPHRQAARDAFAALIAVRS